jgi:DNA-binding transcriptional regulator YiaG
MANLAVVLRRELQRLTSRELREAMRTVRALQKQVAKMRLEQRRHRQAVTALQRRAAAARPGLRNAGGVSAEQIRALRARLEMTREQFARVIGVSPGSIFGWEKGRTLPRGRSVEKLRQAMTSGVRDLRRAATAPTGGRRVIVKAARKARRPSR